MAIINISFDSETKKLSVTKNGSSIENVKYISIGEAYCECEGDEKKFYISIESVDKDSDNGIKQYTTITASDINHAGAAELTQFLNGELK